MIACIQGEDARTGRSPYVAIVRGIDEDYEHRIPGPEDVSLIIEVSLTTLPRDRGEKLSAYARAGIAVSWIVNLVDRWVEVHTGPEHESYACRTDFKPGESVPVVIDGERFGEIAVNAILPSAPDQGSS
jgi:hypothetical protein